MGRSMAEGVRITRIMITLTDKGFLKEEASPLARLLWWFSFASRTCSGRTRRVFTLRFVPAPTPRDHHGATSKRFNRLERKTPANYLQTGVTSLCTAGRRTAAGSKVPPQPFQALSEIKVPGFNWRAGDLMLSGPLIFVCIVVCWWIQSR